MNRNKSVSLHHFSMVPRPEVPRSSLRIEHAYKTTFDAGFLVPIYCEEVLPGDSVSCRMTAFARLATPIFPVMDNLYLDSFFFFVPNRIVWNNWVKFMGEQDNPADSISFVVPTVSSPVGGYPINSIFDYFGLPTVGQVGGANTVTHNALPLRGYNLIYNDWFRDQNLQNSLTVNLADGGENNAFYALRRRGKRHDYFTSSLPWPQKGGTSVSLPLGTSAPVRTQGADTVTGPQSIIRYRLGATGNNPGAGQLGTDAGGLGMHATAAFPGNGVYPSNLFADLSQATAATINQLRQAFQIQKLLERDARGGTRYTEIVRAHFGVISPDARLQRPEFLGGGTTPVIFNPIAQTSGTGASGTTAPPWLFLRE